MIKQVEEFRIKYLGTKGIVKAIMGEMKNVPAEKKKEFGQILNEFKKFAEAKFEELKNETSNVSPKRVKHQTLTFHFPAILYHLAAAIRSH